MIIEYFQGTKSFALNSVSMKAKAMVSTAIFVPYSGNANELQALQFATMVSSKLRANVDVAFVSHSLPMLNSEENTKARQVYESKGYYASLDFQTELHKKHLKQKAVGAKIAFELFLKDNAQKSKFQWIDAIETFVDSEQVFLKDAFLHDFTLASFNICPSVYGDVTDDVLFGVGRPVLLVGDTVATNDLAVVIGWKPTAQSVRAIMAALPLLQVASKCHLVAIEELGDEKMIPSAGDMATYLASKGVKVETKIYPASDANPWELLGDYYKQVDANLMVLGAYSHLRMRELVLGGFTRHFLDSRQYNLFMIH